MEIMEERGNGGWRVAYRRQCRHSGRQTEGTMSERERQRERQSEMMETEEREENVRRARRGMCSGSVGHLTGCLTATSLSVRMAAKRRADLEEDKNSCRTV